MENLNLGGSIDLLALEGAVLIESTKQKGELVLCIPVSKAKLQAFNRENGKTSCFLNIYGVRILNGKSNNDFMFKRSLTKEETEANKLIPNPEERKSGEILGNAKYLEPNNKPATATANSADAVGVEGGDLPF